MALLALFLVLAAPSSKVYRKDVAFALRALEDRCGHFFRTKDIRWAKVRSQFLKEVKRVRSPEEHWMLLWRLVVRLKDGHADVLTTAATKDLKWPGTGLDAGPRVSFVQCGKDLYVERAWGDAASAGVKAGMRVVKVDGRPAAQWLEDRIEELRDTSRLPTPHYEPYFACHWGLAGPRNSRLKLELQDVETKRTKKTTLARTSRGLAPAGPVAFPDGLETMGRLSYGKLPSGHAYIHLRDVPRDLARKLDAMLEKLKDAPGLVLDCRACGGGATDHDAVFGRFVPAGKRLSFGKAYESAGPHPYAGPMVVIVDAGVRSAGETIGGMFKEDGRAYMIGPAPTAGMSSSKTRIELPSGLFTLYVSVASNKRRFNRGKGIEGIGVPPHEIVAYDPDDLAKGADTQIERAVELLERGFPRNVVAYKPERYGWKSR